MHKYVTKPEFNGKKFFIGISFSSITSNESAVAVLDQNLNIILLDKLFSMHDVEHFLTSFQGKENAVIGISMAKNEVMISSRWKYLSRIYHPVNLNSSIKNRDNWADRFSKKGVDFFRSLKNNGCSVLRFDLQNVKTVFGLNGIFLDRTPADCKALQTVLKYKLNFANLPNNMLPVSELEAIMGAYTMYSYTTDIKSEVSKKLFKFHDLDVVGFNQGVKFC
ncbi:MAG: hypothetical protein K6C94_06665 [Candidatus Gastranaerophilales bacterium]|nr:hypothetical protein [Candidatus Gastranaerophilales bacterium]